MAFHLYTSRYTFERELPIIQDKHPEAQFVEEMACRNKVGGYTHEPALVFFQEKPPQPEWPHFFAYNRQPRGPNGELVWMRTGMPKFDPIVTCLLDQDVLVFSRYGHDFVRSPISENCVDGGPLLERVVGPIASSPSKYIVKLNILTLAFEYEGRTHYAKRWSK